MHRIVYLIGSSLLYAAAYQAPSQLWWCAAIWPLILWLYVRTGTIRWYHGYLWAYVTLALQLSGILYGIFYLMSGSTWTCMVFFTLVIAIMAIPGALLFAFAAYLDVYTTNNPIRPFWWLTLWLYLTWMEYASLLFWNNYGCILLSPLIFLSIPYRYIWPIAYLGKPLFLAWWITACMVTAGMFVQRSFIKYFIIIMMIHGTLWYFAPLPSTPPSYLRHIGIIRSSFLLDEGNLSALHHCARHIEHLCNQHHDIQVIILPESSLYPPAIIDNWNSLASHTWTSHVSKPVIFGGYTLCHDSYYNTAAFSYQAQILATFDKQHATPFIERIPSWFQYPCIEKIFYKLYGSLLPGTQPRKVWQLLPSLYVVPYICSELFFGTNPRDEYHRVPILVLCNTKWAPTSAQELMLWGARLRAIEWQRDILFVAQHFSSWCSARGTIVPLISEKNTCS